MILASLPRVPHHSQAAKGTIKSGKGLERLDLAIILYYSFYYAMDVEDRAQESFCVLGSGSGITF